MKLILHTNDEADRRLAHGAIMCSKEQLDESSLMHYRVGGEVKGKRRWQEKDGSLTPAGLEHYREMYGWGKGHDHKTIEGNRDHEQKPVVSRSEFKQIETFMENAIQANSLRGSTVDGSKRRQILERAREKIRKNKKFKELVNDDDIQSKKAEYKKLENEWFDASGGEDFDAWDDKTGPEEYGISKEQYEKAISLDQKRRAAKDNLKQITTEKVKAFVKAYVDNPSSKTKMSKEEIDSVTSLINTIAYLELHEYKQR